MGSGPSNPEPRVLQAMTASPLAPDDPASAIVVDGLVRLTRRVFRGDAACTLAVPGASRAGIEAVLTSLVVPGDRVLVGVYGHFGELLWALATRHGATLERVEAEWGQPVDAQEMAARIRHNPPRLAAIVHADTSTGILQPLDEISRACRESGTLLLVDAVLSLGGCRVEVDQWGLDAAVGGLQKCVGGPPGLALVAYSERVRGALETRREKPHSRYLDLGRLAAQWAEPREAEMATPMLFAAREALRLVLEEGLEARWERHRGASRALRAGLRAMRLDLFGDAEHAAPMITLVVVPDGIDEGGVREQLLNEHGIEIMAAFGPLRGRVWRIGTMGTNAGLPSVLAVLSGLEAVLASRGFKLRRGAGVDAALAANRADPT